ncbi:MAG: biopolymer transporter ExbD [Rhodobacteraceae bacterium]|nr:biopolymer transporter ExbD [Paracoccaceae bacterium]
MDLAAPPATRTRDDGIVPMINVVFLLLVFFLMVATLAPPEPFAVAPPAAAGAPNGARAGGATLHVAADGRLAFEGAEGEAALAAAAAAAGPLELRADRALAAAALARLLARLAGRGREEVRLVVTEGG